MSQIPSIFNNFLDDNSHCYTKKSDDNWFADEGISNGQLTNYLTETARFYLVVIEWTMYGDWETSSGCFHNYTQRPATQLLILINRWPLFWQWPPPSQLLFCHTDSNSILYTRIYLTERSNQPEMKSTVHQQFLLRVLENVASEWLEGAGWHQLIKRGIDSFSQHSHTFTCLSWR